MGQNALWEASVGKSMVASSSRVPERNRMREDMDCRGGPSRRRMNAHAASAGSLSSLLGCAHCCLFQGKEDREWGRQVLTQTLFKH